MLFEATRKRIRDDFERSFFQTIRMFRRFTFQGKRYRYFCHKYNVAYKNERTVEVPIIWEIVKAYRGKRILEVGNVLSHYFPVNHDILDKYEQGAGVINADVMRFRPPGRYDLIVSISTLEHVGWDEKTLEPMKASHAISKLAGWLKRRGLLVVTFALGSNRVLDRHIREKRLPFTQQFFLRRISWDNCWREVPFGEILDAKYGVPYPYGNVVVVGIVEKQSAFKVF